MHTYMSMHAHTLDIRCILMMTQHTSNHDANIGYWPTWVLAKFQYRHSNVDIYTVGDAWTGS
jgi:hypothetical protein